MTMYAILIENKLELTIYGSIKHLCADYSLPYRSVLAGKRVLLSGTNKIEIVEVNIHKHKRKRK